MRRIICLTVCAVLLAGCAAAETVTLPNSRYVIDVPDSIIQDRIAGRRTCPKCKAGYHVRNLPPKVEGVCDVCGGTEFARRKDDNRTTVENRLVNYRLLTYPTIPFFESRGLLKTVDGTGTIDAVSRKIEDVLGLRAAAE